MLDVIYVTIMVFINPVRDLGQDLLSVEKPARYTGGEFGRLCKQESLYKTVIAFPDLYEIGMSNQAIKIIYKRLNEIPEISCDRAFAPAPDFEELLRNKKIPLYGLDSGISLKDTDLLMFSLGYELGFTNIFNMLELSFISLRNEHRKEDDPLIILGGPCASNPLPYSVFIDAFWIGEAEGGFFELVNDLKEKKKSGMSRGEIKKILSSHPSVWVKGKEKAIKAVDSSFSFNNSGAAVFPVPSMQVVHHHGAVEIMRGCPNGCRFCHAGFWYRPMRQKCANLIEQEAEDFINKGGFREITLSSLSSGDYSYIDSLFEKLSQKYKDKNISFQMPSLKVSGFSLDLIEKISRVRKGGLTFAVETPSEFGQMALNKKVYGSDVVSILTEAKKRGWRTAKFYFMIGLPLEIENDKKEEEEIVDFISEISEKTRMRFNINIGTFIPKAHTPFERASQLNKVEAEKKLNYLKYTLKSMGHKVGIQDPFISQIEGILSRGDERAGEIFYEAFLLGCRLDSWSDFLKQDIWDKLLLKYNELINEISFEKKDTVLAWHCIDSGIHDYYLKEEYNKSTKGELSLPCIKNCTNPCGACYSGAEIVNNITQSNVISQIENPKIDLNKKDPDINRIIFSFSKTDSAIFHSHLGLIEIFSMSFIRGSIPVLFTRGFNPLPKLDIAAPLSLGISALNEFASVELSEYYDAEKFILTMNKCLPDGIKINEASNTLIKSGMKKHSVSSLVWGFKYNVLDQIDIVEAKNEKMYRKNKIENEKTPVLFTRLSVLAKYPAVFNKEEKGYPFFEVYKAIYSH